MNIALLKRKGKYLRSEDLKNQKASPIPSHDSSQSIVSDSTAPLDSDLAEKLKEMLVKRTRIDCLQDYNDDCGLGCA